MEVLLVLEKSSTEKNEWLKNACWQGVHFIKRRILIWSYNFWNEVITKFILKQAYCAGPRQVVKVGK